MRSTLSFYEELSEQWFVRSKISKSSDDFVAKFGDFLQFGRPQLQFIEDSECENGKGVLLQLRCNMLNQFIHFKDRGNVYLRCLVHFMAG